MESKLELEKLEELVVMRHTNHQMVLSKLNDAYTAHYKKPAEAFMIFCLFLEFVGETRLLAVMKRDFSPELFANEWWHLRLDFQSKSLITSTSWWKSLPTSQKSLPGNGVDNFDCVYMSRLSQFSDTLVGLTYLCFACIGSIHSDQLGSNLRRFEPVAKENVTVAGALFDYMEEFTRHTLNQLRTLKNERWPK